MFKALLSFVVLASLSFAAPLSAEPARVWKYAILQRSSFPTLKKQMWMTSDKTIAIEAETKLPEALELMGDNGWELVSVVRHEGGTEPYITTFYFKK